MFIDGTDFSKIFSILLNSFLLLHVSSHFYAL